jgi:hypothetical protein
MDLTEALRLLRPMLSERTTEGERTATALAVAHLLAPAGHLNMQVGNAYAVVEMAERRGEAAVRTSVLREALKGGLLPVGGL